MREVFSKVFTPLMFLLLSGCPSSCPTCKEPTPADKSGCPTACSRLRELNCEEGKPTARGASCEEVCENMQQTGLLPYDLMCAARISACHELKSCEAKRK